MPIESTNSIQITGIRDKYIPYYKTAYFVINAEPR